MADVLGAIAQSGSDAIGAIALQLLQQRHGKSYCLTCLVLLLRNELYPHSHCLASIAEVRAEIPSSIVFCSQG